MPSRLVQTVTAGRTERAQRGAIADAHQQQADIGRARRAPDAAAEHDAIALPAAPSPAPSRRSSRYVVAGNDRLRRIRAVAVACSVRAACSPQAERPAGRRLRPRQPAPRTTAADQDRRHSPTATTPSKPVAGEACALLRHAQGRRKPRPRARRWPRTRQATILRRMRTSMLTCPSGQFEDPIGDDAELNFGGAGIDRLGPRLQINSLEAPLRDRHRGLKRQRAPSTAIPSPARQNADAPRSSAALQGCRARRSVRRRPAHPPPSRHAPSARRCRQWSRQASPHSDVLQQPGKNRIGLAGSDQMAKFILEAPGAVHAVGRALDRQHTDRGRPTLVGRSQGIASATSTLSKNTSQKLSLPSIDLMVRRARRAASSGTANSASPRWRSSTVRCAPAADSVARGRRRWSRSSGR